MAGSIVVQKLVLDLKIKHTSNAKQIEQDCIRLIISELEQAVAAIEKEFGISPTEYIQIPKLEIDLGKIKLSDLANSLVVAFRRELLRIIQSNAFQNKVKQASGTKKKERKLIDAFTFFLSNSFFPWWFTDSKFKNIDKLVEELLKKNKKQFYNACVHLLDASKPKSEQVAERLGTQLSPKIFAAFVKVMVEQALPANEQQNTVQKRLSATMQRLAKRMPKNAIGNRLKLFLQQGISVGVLSPKDSGTFNRKLIRELQKGRYVPKTALLQYILSTAKDKNIVGLFEFFGRHENVKNESTTNFFRNLLGRNRKNIEAPNIKELSVEAQILEQIAAKVSPEVLKLLTKKELKAVKKESTGFIANLLKRNKKSIANTNHKNLSAEEQIAAKTSPEVLKLLKKKGLTIPKEKAEKFDLSLFHEEILTDLVGHYLFFNQFPAWAAVLVERFRKEIRATESIEVLERLVRYLREKYYNYFKEKLQALQKKHPSLLTDMAHIYPDVIVKLLSEVVLVDKGAEVASVWAKEAPEVLGFVQDILASSYSFSVLATVHDVLEFVKSQTAQNLKNLFGIAGSEHVFSYQFTPEIRLAIIHKLYGKQFDKINALWQELYLISRDVGFRHIPQKQLDLLMQQAALKAIVANETDVISWAKVTIAELYIYMGSSDFVMRFIAAIRVFGKSRTPILYYFIEAEPEFLTSINEEPTTKAYNADLYIKERPALIFEHFAFYLKHGYIHWQSPFASFRKLNDFVQMERETLVRLYLNELKSLLLLPVALERLYGVFYKSTAAFLYQACNSSKSDNLNNIVADAGKQNVSEIKNGFTDNVRDDLYQKLIKEKVDWLDNDKKQKTIYVENAGLVLLWTFMPFLFNRLGMLKKNDKKKNVFIDRQAQERAIHLTQFMVTGTENPQEFDLPLNKLICGWELGRPVRRDIKLTDEERKECEILLKSAIKHWSILGNTSPDGLRTSFLKRKGAIAFKNKNITLKVEQTGIDVLVSKIPWTFQTLKFPWNEYFIFVEWNA